MERFAKNKEVLKDVSRSARREGQAIKIVMTQLYQKRRIVLKKEGESFFVRSRWSHAEERRNISTRSSAASTSEEERKRKDA
jgi:hypothetical protein